VNAHTLSRYLPSSTKLWCTRQLRGQIHSILHVLLYGVCVYEYDWGIEAEFQLKADFSGRKAEFEAEKVTVSASQLSLRIRPLVMRGREWKESK
jgi:hypothetical protein